MHARDWWKRMKALFANVLFPQLPPLPYLEAPVEEELCDLTFEAEGTTCRVTPQEYLLALRQSQVRRYLS